MNGVPVPLDEATLRTEIERQVLRGAGVVAFTPHLSPDGSHEHVAARDGEWALTTMASTAGIRSPLVQRDTDEISPCIGLCDGDHDPIYVKEWWCRFCDTVLDATVGERSTQVVVGAQLWITVPVPDAVFQPGPLPRVFMLRVDTDTGGMDFAGQVTYTSGGCSFTGSAPLSTRDLDRLAATA